MRFREPFSTKRFVQAAIAVCLLHQGPAWSFFYDPHPFPSPVLEYFNESLGHYFYTATIAEENAIGSGSAGPGWVKTGLGFQAWESLEQSANGYYPTTCDKDHAPCVPIQRFYGTPGLGPNSHFFTGNEVEAALLRRPGSGWQFEKIAFYAPLPDQTSGQCASQLMPVFRLYNNRWMFNDSNHRFTASKASRARMIAQGWIDEGIAFCAYGKVATYSDSITFSQKDPAAIQPQAVCRNGSSTFDSCIGVSNVPLPTAIVHQGDVEFCAEDPFGRALGSCVPPRYVVNVAVSGESAAVAASYTFIQLAADTADPTHGPGGSYVGIHLTTDRKGASPYSSVSAIRRLSVSSPTSGNIDARYFPFPVRYSTDYELRLSGFVGIKTLAATPGSAAYGDYTIDFLDTISGHTIRVNIAAYGTMSPVEIVSSDALAGTTIVGTAFGVSSRYGRFTGPMLRGPTVLWSDSGQTFSASIDRLEFQAAIDDARRVDQALSPNPYNYVVANFGSVNEISGDGEIGMWLAVPSICHSPQL